MSRIFEVDKKLYCLELFKKIIESIQIIERKRMLELIHGMERPDTIDVLLAKSNRNQ